MSQVGTPTTRPVHPDERDWVRAVLARRWAGTVVVSLGTPKHADRLPGFVAELDGERVGLVTYRIHSRDPARPGTTGGDATGGQVGGGRPGGGRAGGGIDCELMTIDALRGGVGAGTVLLDAVAAAARAAGAARVWLITTNDNTPALRFYQRRGFDLVAVHRDAITAARRRKPSIPETGVDGIPIRHGLELEFALL
jgi:ribosomal protein S18 acetylase RimI-like enzyme